MNNGVSMEFPDRRTAIVVKELAQYNIDIAALSETRFVEEGLLKESPSGFTFYFSGRDKNNRRQAGVGFATKNSIAIIITP
jgi:exonuclease III